MHDQSPIHRHWLLLRTLSARRYGLTVRAMADETRVGLKTIRRDLDLFRTLAFPLEETVSEFGRKTYRMTNPADVPPLSFRLDEALALYLSRRFLEPLAGTQFWEAAQSAFRKIRALLGEPALAYAERMSCFFHATRVGVSDYSQNAKLLDALTQGIEDSRAVHLLMLLRPEGNRDGELRIITISRLIIRINQKPRLPYGFDQNRVYRVARRRPRFT